MPLYYRRNVLKIGLSAAAASMLPLNALAAAMQMPDNRRSLDLYNIHTAERLSVCYYKQGAYLPKALTDINHILRDHRTGDVTDMQTELLDLLYAVKRRIRAKGPFSIISGYRCPSTNEALRRKTDGVAKKSYHTKGMAIDIRLPGYDT
ncbi:MAG: DUF882 domain-containing protein, partial [Desulfatitalea sp.]|nr:DUF882 domain-containing protein [Desulfatitalea sp.]NNK02420.1 DUF882 domain-containing protein [Desulfatitalea sp.]